MFFLWCMFWGAVAAVVVFLIGLVGDEDDTIDEPVGGHAAGTDDLD